MDYGTIGLALALLSSATTASAHALLKAGKDKLALRALIGAVGTIALGPFCLFVPVPTRDLLPWLAAANVLHTSYQLVLIRAYAASDFSVAYPLARGIVPIATATTGMVLLGDRLNLGTIAGIILTSLGILMIGIGRTVPVRALAAAITAGLLTAAYTVVDASAVRLAPVAMTFIAWFFLLDGLIILAIVAVVRRGRVICSLCAEGRHGLWAGIASLVSFGSALLALRLAAVGVVSALRETSVAFAIVIATVVLRERIDRRRTAALVTIAAGTVLILATIDRSSL
ncbi:MAG: DMT family transporter [Sphingomonas fennica]